MWRRNAARVLEQLNESDKKLDEMLRLLREEAERREQETTDDGRPDDRS